MPSAILFDLALGDASIRPGPELGRGACRNAAAGPVPEGNAGVGAGATVGKILGHERAMKGGLGSAAVRIGPLVVAALVAVNAVGDVIDPETGRILAGVRSAGGRGFADTMKVLRERGMPPRRSGEGENTTLGVVATNAAFDKAALTKIAQMSHDGLARDHPARPHAGGRGYAVCPFHRIDTRAGPRSGRGTRVPSHCPGRGPGRPPGPTASRLPLRLGLPVGILLSCVPYRREDKLDGQWAGAEH